MAQRGYAQLDYQAHLDPWLPGMIATQYPKAIKSGLFQSTAKDSSGNPTGIIKFGLGCGRDGAGSVATDTPSNFGDRTGEDPANYKYPGRPVAKNSKYLESSARYAAGGGAIVTETIKRKEDKIALIASDISNHTTAQIKLKTIAANNTKFRDMIAVGDYLIIRAPSSKVNKEIVQVGSVQMLTATEITYNVIRYAFGSYPTGTVDINVDDEVILIGDHNFAGVCVKDITIDGRWTQDSGDAFMHGDEIPVGVEGDFAVRVCGVDNTSDATIKADELVSIYIGDTEKKTDTITHPRIHGSFSNAPASKDYIVLKNARWTTGNQAVNTYPATFPPGGSGLDSPTKVDVAVARFAANT